MKTKPTHRRFLRHLVFSMFLGILWISPSISNASSVNIITVLNLARKAGVPEKATSQVFALGYKYGLKEHDVAIFISILTRARLDNLPVDPLVIKLNEGLVKKINQRIIKRVLRREISNELFVCKVAFRAMKRWGFPFNKLSPNLLLVRMSKTLLMGISKNEMKYFFAHAPRASLPQIASALEFLAALKQASLNSQDATRLVFIGLKSKFFSRTDWQLPLMVKAAKQKNISENKIVAAAMNVIIGKASFFAVNKRLGLNPKDFAICPKFSIFSGKKAAGDENENVGKSTTDITDRQLSEHGEGGEIGGADGGHDGGDGDGGGGGGGGGDGG